MEDDSDIAERQKEILSIVELANKVRNGEGIDQDDVAAIMFLNAQIRINVAMIDMVLEGKLKATYNPSTDEEPSFKNTELGN